MTRRRASHYAEKLGIFFFEIKRNGLVELLNHYYFKFSFPSFTDVLEIQEMPLFAFLTVTLLEIYNLVLSTGLIKPNSLVILPTDAAPQFLSKLTPLFFWKCMSASIPKRQVDKIHTSCYLRWTPSNFLIGTGEYGQLNWPITVRVLTKRSNKSF